MVLSRRSANRITILAGLVAILLVATAVGGAVIDSPTGQTVNGTVQAGEGTAYSYVAVVDGEADGDDEFASIQAAVDAASDDDRIYVRPGTYRESVWIDDDIHLVGVGETILDGDYKRDGWHIDAFRIQDNSSPIIDGFDIRNYESALTEASYSRTRTENGWTLRDSRITGLNDTAGAVIAAESDYWQIRNVTIDAAGEDAIRVDGYSWEIHDTHIRNFSTAIGARYGSGSGFEIADSVITGPGDVGIGLTRIGNEAVVKRTRITNVTKAAIDFDEFDTGWRVRDSVLSSQGNHTLTAVVENPYNRHPTGDARENYWVGSSAERCRGRVNCSNPLDTRPEIDPAKPKTHNTLPENLTLTLTPDRRIRTASEGDTVELAAPVNGSDATYDWTQMAGPGVTLRDGTTNTPEFTAPTVVGERTLSFEVVVDTGDGDPTRATRNVTVFGRNDPPEAEAGPNRTIDEATTVALDPNASSDPEGDDLTYNWSQVSGPSLPLADADTASPEVDVVPIGRDVTLTYRLTVSDGSLTSNDTVRITVPATGESFEYGYDSDVYTANEDTEALFESLELQYQQRVGELPPTVTIDVVDEAQLGSRCGPAAGACAIGDRIVMTHPGTYAFPRVMLRHELTHVIQDRMADSVTDEWQFILEGHAEYEDRPAYVRPRLEEKPSLIDLKSFEVETQEYDEAAHFVDAFMIEYGRQAMFDLYEHGGDLEDAFRAATGESLFSFYDRWQPTDPSEGPNAKRYKEYPDSDYAESKIPVKPMFVHDQGLFRVLKMVDQIDSVEWDVDGDGEYERRGEAVYWLPEDPGTYEIGLRLTNGNYSLEQTQRIDITETVDADRPTEDPPSPLDPQDPDDDGRYEDVNGDGETNVFDAITYYNERDSETIQGNPGRFDFDGNGTPGTVFDAIELYESITE